MSLTDAQRAVLHAVADTVVPALDPPPGDPDADGFWARTASDVGVPAMAEDLLSQAPPDQQAGMGQLLDALAAQGFAGHSQRSREQLLRNLALVGPEAAAGVGALIGMALFLAYGAPDPASGRNPFWQTFGYAGPLSAPPPEPKPIAPLVPEGDELALEADVCVVGSGAGGGVIAAELSAQGLKVCVLEAGQYLNEADFLMLELPAYQSMYWRGGPQSTANLDITLQAGATLGGGTTINWTNCLRTRPWVREQWAREHGLEGVDGAEFDHHLDAVLQRISATDGCSDRNGTQELMRQGAEALGWSSATIVRNTDPGRYDPATAGYMGFGDQSGSKQSTAKTYLRDAFDAGADILTGTRAQRVLVEGGRAAGVEAVYTDAATGRTIPVTVRAPRVVVACGALESPALLLRSGIGGPAVGRHLRVHPCTAVLGTYGEETRAWWGPPQSYLVDEFADAEDGYGFLIESTQYTPGLAASAVPFTSAAEHKSAMHDFGFGATFIGLLRDRGAGQVSIDAAGEAVPVYALTDELDVRNTHRSLEAQVRLHVAAGAIEIAGLAAGLPRWRRGDDVDAFIARLQRIPLRFGGHRLFSAHQMGTCRMGADPRTSVAGPWGELHDTPGVWIGDGSAFPTAAGTNPMISIMALARRTAHAIAATADRPAATQAVNA